MGNQLDTHVHLRLIVSVVEPDVHRWSYWLSRFGYETRKVERTLWNRFLSFLIAIYIAHRSFAIDFTYRRSLEKSLKSIYYSRFAKRDVILNFNLGNKSTDYSIS